MASAAKVVATYSYGIYITHMFALAPLHGLMQGPLFAQWAAALILLPGLAFLAYHGIEAPGIALGARAAQRLQDRARISHLRERLNRGQVATNTTGL